MKLDMNYYECIVGLARDSHQILTVLKDTLYHFDTLEKKGVDCQVETSRKNQDALYYNLKKNLLLDLFPPIDRDDFFLLATHLRELGFYSEQLIVAIEHIPTDVIYDVILESASSLERITMQLITVLQELIHFEKYDMLSEKTNEISTEIFEKYMNLMEVINPELYFLTDFFHRAFQSLMNVVNRMNIVFLKYS